MTIPLDSDDLKNYMDHEVTLRYTGTWVGSSCRIELEITFWCPFVVGALISALAFFQATVWTSILLAPGHPALGYKTFYP